MAPGDPYPARPTPTKLRLSLYRVWRVAAAVLVLGLGGQSYAAPERCGTPRAIIAVPRGRARGALSIVPCCRAAHHVAAHVRAETGVPHLRTRAAPVRLGAGGIDPMKVSVALGSRGGSPRRQPGAISTKRLGEVLQ